MKPVPGGKGHFANKSLRLRNRPLALTSRSLVKTIAPCHATPPPSFFTYLWWDTFPLKTCLRFSPTSLSKSWSYSSLSSMAVAGLHILLGLNEKLRQLIIPFCQHWRKRKFVEESSWCTCHLWIVKFSFSLEISSFQMLFSKSLLSFFQDAIVKDQVQDANNSNIYQIFVNCSAEYLGRLKYS